VREPCRHLLGVALHALDDGIDRLVVESAEGRSPIDPCLFCNNASGTPADTVHAGERALDAFRPVEVGLADADEIPNVLFVLGFCVWVFCTHDVSRASWRGFEPRRLCATELATLRLGPDLATTTPLAIVARQDSGPAPYSTSYPH